MGCADYHVRAVVGRVEPEPRPALRESTIAARRYVVAVQPPCPLDKAELAPSAYAFVAAGRLALAALGYHVSFCHRNIQWVSITVAAKNATDRINIVTARPQS